LTLVSLKVLSQFFPSAESNGMFSICVSLLSISIAASENSSSRHLQTSCHFRRQEGKLTLVHTHMQKHKQTHKHMANRHIKKIGRVRKKTQRKCEAEQNTPESNQE
jgi:hypothetical protein